MNRQILSNQAEPPLWNMQWWQNARQVKLHEDAEKETV